MSSSTNRTRTLTSLGILTAIILVMTFTPLGYTKTMGLEITLLHIPVILGAALTGPAGGMVQGISAADCVMITVSGKSGVRVGTKKAYRAAEGKPRMFVVTKLDDENANFYNVLTELKSAFGPSVCPVVVPVIADRKVDSYINLIEMKAYRYDKDGKELSLTKKSDTEHTFVMPTGKVEITPSFVKQAEEPSRVFVDVKTGDYFYDAVLWAVEKGITNGTSAETFSPEDPCTRA